MSTRTLRAWAILAVVLVVAGATVLGTPLAQLGAGMLLIAFGLFLVRLDIQRKRGRTRR
jgi:hypothetical protein